MTANGDDVDRLATVVVEVVRPQLPSGGGWLIAGILIGTEEAFEFFQVGAELFLFSSRSFDHRTAVVGGILEGIVAGRSPWGCFLTGAGHGVCNCSMFCGLTLHSGRYLVDGGCRGTSRDGSGDILRVSQHGTGAMAASESQ